MKLRFLKIRLVHIHYESEWEFWLGFWLGGNTTHIHDFCVPLDFLGIKDPQKNEKRPKKKSKAIDKATATLIEILLSPKETNTNYFI